MLFVTRISFGKIDNNKQLGKQKEMDP